MIAITFEHDFSDYSKLWRDYYSRFMDIKVIKIGDMLRSDWGATTKLLNSSQECFKDHDLILYADVDEILIPDPDKYKDLGEYLESIKNPVVRCTGYNVMEMKGDEPLNMTKPILSQRKYWERDDIYDKFVIITEPQVYLNNHHIQNEVARDPDLVMFHLRDSDITGARARNNKLGVNYDYQAMLERRQRATLIPNKYLNLV